jgi:predicted Zn-dependent protease
MPTFMRYISLLLMLTIIGGCATNPVTGKSEMKLISEQQELAMGKENYAPLQQMQGGQYSVDKELTSYVQQVGNKLAAVSDRKLPYEFVVLNNSVPNAWALPGGKIAVNRGLLVELNNEAELAAVLGHEIVHAAARHSAKKLETGMAINVGLVTLAVLTGKEENRGAYLAAGTVGAALLSQKYSRDAELESDHYGIKYMVQAGYDPYAAVSLQETFVRLSEGKQQNWLEGLFASHPPSMERVEKNREMAKSLYRNGLVKNEAAYKKRIAHLKKVRPAYDKETKAYAEMKNKNYQAAMKLANEAIGLEPREASFYALRGDIYQQQKQHNKAIKEYDQAVKRDSAFFYPYLQRGLSYKEQGDKAKAKADLQKSMLLLPTKEAQTALQALN